MQTSTSAASNLSEPEVGMGATIRGYTDRIAATVVQVEKNKAGLVTKVVVQEDKAYRLDNNGMSEVQDYRYEPNPMGAQHVFTRRSDGKFRQAGTGSYGVSFATTRSKLKALAERTVTWL